MAGKCLGNRRTFNGYVIARPTSFLGIYLGRPALQSLESHTCNQLFIKVCSRHLCSVLALVVARAGSRKTRSDAEPGRFDSRGGRDCTRASVVAVDGRHTRMLRSLDAQAAQAAAVRFQHTIWRGLAGSCGEGSKAEKWRARFEDAKVARPVQGSRARGLTAPNKEP